MSDNNDDPLDRRVWPMKGAKGAAMSDDAICPDCHEHFPTTGMGSPCPECNGGPIESVEEWGKHQVPVSDEMRRGIEAVLATPAKAVAYGAFDRGTDRCYVAASVRRSVEAWIGLDDRFHVEPLYRGSRKP